MLMVCYIVFAWLRNISIFNMSILIILLSLGFVLSAEYTEFVLPEVLGVVWLVLAVMMLWDRWHMYHVVLKAFFSKEKLSTEGVVLKGCISIRHPKWHMSISLALLDECYTAGRCRIRLERSYYPDSKKRYWFIRFVEKTGSRVWT